MAMGFHIGIDGPVTFRKAVDLREVARRAPREQILLETDGPYLTPAPCRGERNEPAYLTYIAEKIAEVRGLTTAAILASTTRSATALFNL
jgi:TatD DNase family protein